MIFKLRNTGRILLLFALVLLSLGVSSCEETSTDAGSADSISFVTINPTFSLDEIDEECEFSTRSFAFSANYSSESAETTVTYSMTIGDVSTTGFGLYDFGSKTFSLETIIDSYTVILYFTIEDEEYAGAMSIIDTDTTALVDSGSFSGSLSGFSKSVSTGEDE
jgi:hypothetical protein